MRETHFFGQAFVIGVLFAVTLYLGLDIYTGNETPFVW